MSAKEEQSSDLVNVAELADLVAHEVNNLLNSIVLHAALLERSLPKEAQAAVQAEMGTIRQSIQRAGAMLRRWQQATPKQAGPVEAFDLNRLIGDLSLPPRLRGTADQDVSLRVQLTPELPVVLGNRADTTRLLNLLIKSAVEASRDGGTVTLRTELTHGHVLLCVEDQGAAVEPELLERLFEPFAAVRGGLFAKSDEEELWLATCKVLARRQKCTITATQGNAGGVTISVRYPAAAGDKA